MNHVCVARPFMLCALLLFAYLPAHAQGFFGTTTLLAFEISVNNERVVRLEPGSATEGPNVIMGWSGNTVSPGVLGATICGGGNPDDGAGPAPNRVESNYGTVCGGFRNSASGAFSSIGGGERNTASGSRSTIGAGDGNTASGAFSSIGGGNLNTASGERSTIGGGHRNTVSGSFSTIGGGDANTASGDYSTVPGGTGNAARGNRSFAAGYSAKALHDGTFVWSDNSQFPGIDLLFSTGEDQFLLRAAGGLGLGTNAPLAPGGIHVRTNALSLTADALNFDDILVESPDAGLGLYSDNAGLYASALTLGRVNGTGALSNKWTILQRTTNNNTNDDDNALQFRFGTNANYGFNAIILELDGDGGATFVRPGNDGSIELGQSTRRWEAVYAVNGTIQTSDARFKQDIENLDYGLPEVLRLRPVRYSWKDRPEGGEKLGLIAQEVAAVMPEVVQGSEGSGTLGMNYGELVPVLVGAMQAQQAEIVAQEEEIDALKARLATLEGILLQRDETKR